MTVSAKYMMQNLPRVEHDFSTQLYILLIPTLRTQQFLVEGSLERNRTNQNICSQIDGLVQERRYSSALAIELRFFLH